VPEEAAGRVAFLTVVYLRTGVTVGLETAPQVPPVITVPFQAVGAVLPKMMVAGATVPLAVFVCGLGDGDIYCGSDDPKIRRRYVYSP
jgi:hypothetical protein